MLSQFSYGTFEHERTRAAILLALTKLHSAISFEENEYVQQIMSDYLYSRSLEVQQRASEYKFLKEKANVLPGGPREYIFRTPLTETQVAQETLDFSLSFADNFVQAQLAEGKPAYDPAKSQIVDDGTTVDAGGSGLVFTPYQAATIGVTKHSQSLQQSNPLILASQGGAAAATNTGEAAPFNVTGVNPGLSGAQNASLAITGVKKVWGAAPVEEAKVPEATSSTSVPTLNTPSQGGAWGGASTATTTTSSKPAKQETKADKKKAKAAAALFGGISAANKDSSDSDDSDDEPAEAS